MNTVPYMYVPLIALACYAFILTAFLAAKKDPTIKAFIYCMIGFLAWTGGSLFMRLQLPPGPTVWYDVSIMSLFSLAFLYYVFVANFARRKTPFTTALWGTLTLVLLVLTYFEIPLARPVMSLLPDGRTIFVYNIGWGVVIPVALFACIAVSIARMIIETIREQGINAPGLWAVIASCVLMAVGNIVSILPNNYFPYDTLAGILNAMMLMYALYKKRLFRMKLLISRGSLVFISALLVSLVASYFVAPAQAGLLRVFPALGDNVVVVLVVMLTLLLIGCYLIIKRLIDSLFYRDEQQQNQAVENFSAAAAQTLRSNDILTLLVNVVKQNAPCENVHVCLMNDGRYEARHSSNALDSASFSIPSDSPLIQVLRDNDCCLLMREFRASTLYLSMWASEKQLLKELNISCLVGLKDGDDIVGIILLTHKKLNSSFTQDDISFLGTVATIASIALKNAGLYEQVYREARTDGLTGLYNHKHFYDVLKNAFDKLGSTGDPITLMFLDLDDFKLYNNLYGTSEGDATLKRVAEIIDACTGKGGLCCRYSGKVFAVLLQGLDSRKAKNIANEISHRVRLLNASADRRMFKELTISVGICTYPYAAANAKELIDHADMAVFNSKNNGKNNVTVYVHEEQGNSTLLRAPSFVVPSDRAREEADSPSFYSAYAPTVYALTAAIDAKDHYTFAHSKNVARYATSLAAAAGINRDHTRIIYEAGMLHDIGKISIPESILSKTSTLTNEEYETMKSHVNSSIDMIRHLPSMDYVIPAAIGHHERWDGRGYPRGIAGEQIPMGARCLAVADAFDAMTTDRPYRKALTAEFAAEQIAANSGTQFDPDLAALFVRLLKDGEILLGASEQ